MNKIRVKCCCGKMLARHDGEYIYFFCKNCKKEIAVKLQKLEPKSQENKNS